MKRIRLTNKNIQNKNKEVGKLKEQIDQAVSKVEELTKLYNDDNKIDSVAQAEYFFNQFYLSSLTDFTHYELGKKKDFPTKFFTDKTKWRQERDKKIEEFYALSHQHKIGQLELLQDKIALLEKKIEDGNI